MQEDETPEHVEKYKKLKKKAEQMIDTTDHEHRNAYLKAVDAHLRDEETKLVDYELLDNDEVQFKFVETMSEHYISKAREALKVGEEELDPMEQAMLMNAYAGTTREQLKQIVTRRGKDLTFEAYDRQYRPDFMKNISEVLKGAAGEHLKDEHIGDLVSESKASDLVNTDYLTLQEAKNIYSLYTEQGSVTRKMLEDAARKGMIAKTSLKKKKKT